MLVRVLCPVFLSLVLPHNDLERAACVEPNVQRARFRGRAVLKRLGLTHYELAFCKRAFRAVSQGGASF